MSRSIILTDRDRLIIHCLGNRIRLLTPDQLSRGFFDGDDRYAQRRIRSLSGMGLVDIQELVVRLTPPLSAPLLVWEPGQASPDYGKYSSMLISRWKRQASIATKVISLGKNASKIIGTKHRPGLKSSLQVGHDLALSEVFLHYLTSAPGIAHSWITEDRLTRFGISLPRRGQAVPDAMIIDNQSQQIRAIELGGLYSPERLQNLHESFSSRRLSYELW